MAQEEGLNPLLWWRPWPPGDPGPEVFALMHSLPVEQQAQLLKVVSEAHAHINSARSNAYSKIAEVMDAAARGGRR